jgi:hypothetical protein
MAAPIRADVRTVASKKEWATYPTVIAMVDAQTATRKFMILDITRLCAPLRVNCAPCLAEQAIQFCDFSCDFVPMIWDIAPPPARGLQTACLHFVPTRIYIKSNHIDLIDRLRPARLAE